MNKYGVTMPIAGFVYVEVEAEDEAEAIEAAWDSFEDETPEAEWDYHQNIVEGNVCHASPNTVDVKLLS